MSCWCLSSDLGTQCHLVSFAAHAYASSSLAFVGVVSFACACPDSYLVKLAPKRCLLGTPVSSQICNIAHEVVITLPLLYASAPLFRCCAKLVPKWCQKGAPSSPKFCNIAHEVVITPLLLYASAPLFCFCAKSVPIWCQKGAPRSLQVYNFALVVFFHCSSLIFLSRLCVPHAAPPLVAITPLYWGRPFSSGERPKHI